MGNEQSRRRRSAHASDKVDATVINPDGLNITITGGYVYANLASLQVAVAPGSDTSLKVGQTARLHATGTYTDGSTGDVTGQVQWSSDHLDVVKVDAAGVVTGSRRGRRRSRAGGSGDADAGWDHGGACARESVERGERASDGWKHGAIPAPIPVGR